MSIVTIFSARYCGGENAASAVAERLGYRLIHEEKDLLPAAAEKFHVTPDKLRKALRGQSSVFDNFTRDRERCTAYVKAALAETLVSDNIVYSGMASLLIPRKADNVLKVCLTAPREYRVAAAVESGEAANEKEALKSVSRDERELTQWAAGLFNKSPWDKDLYDIKIPMNETSGEEAVSTICSYAQKEILQSSDASTRLAEDFLTTSLVQVELVKHGHFDVEVLCDRGVVTILINKHVLRLTPLARELEGIAGSVAGVKIVEAKAGPGYHQADIYRRQTFELPQKVLLVDDEKEYVQTLSERLQMRDFGTAVALNGEEAISMMETEEPDVMVLDLRMPGIDGLEVLRKLKREHPGVEVIILTGHGTEKDRELAEELGAFAYLEKPVDIEKLSETMKAAYRKVREKNNEV